MDQRTALKLEGIEYLVLLLGQPNDVIIRRLKLITKARPVDLPCRFQQVNQHPYRVIRERILVARRSHDAPDGEFEAVKLAGINDDVTGSIDTEVFSANVDARKGNPSLQTVGILKWPGSRCLGDLVPERVEVVPCLLKRASREFMPYVKAVDAVPTPAVNSNAATFDLKHKEAQFRMDNQKVDLFVKIKPLRIPDEASYTMHNNEPIGQLLLEALEEPYFRFTLDALGDLR
ncbi:MAG TPA: hypothetical protein VFS96_00380, partial [Nitrolancea sp.]|nr:hypothetical protein [Nitrolancea sp.]